MTDHSDLIERLRLIAMGHLKPDNGSSIPLADELRRAADALSSQSLSLSEARDEIERLRQEKRDVLQRANDCVLSMLFMPGIRAALDKLPPDDPVEPYMERLRELEAKEARLAALENGPAAFADATNDPASSDLSSLRKGAEEPCPHAPTYDAGLCCGHPDDCTFVSPSALVSGSREDGADA